MRRAGQLLAVLCVVALLVTLCGCGGSGSPAGRSVDTKAPGGVPGKPDKPPKPPDEPEPPPEEPDPDADPAIAFTASCSRELWVMNADGTNRALLVGDATVQSASWSPDGRWLVFNNVYGGYPITTLEGRGLYVVSVDGGTPRLLVPAPDPSSAWCPAWSPGGDRIAYGWDDDSHDINACGEIRAISPDGGTPDILYEFEYPLALLNGISWSPQADRLTVAILDYSIEESTKSSLAILDVDTGNLEDVTRPAGFDWVWGADAVDWARTSDRIAFYGSKAGEASALWILDVETGASEELLDDVGIGCSPSWSPDDSQLVIRKGGEPCFVDVATGAQTPVPGKNWKERAGSKPDWRRF